MRIVRKALALAAEVLSNGARRNGDARRPRARQSREELKEHFRRGLKTGR
jgi:hypothetical protein